MIDPTKATEFLASGRIVVVGASDDKKNFGRTICQELIDHGIETLAVHPSATTVAGAPCYPTLDSVPGVIDGVIVMVSSERAADAVRACSERQIRRVWLFKGVGHGAVSDDALRLCEEHGIDVIAGACPLMFLEPVSGIHKFHRAVRHANRSLAKTA